RDCCGSAPARRGGPPVLAFEFFARCVTEPSWGVFYRTLAKCADEPSLRALAAEAARDHSAYFNFFRSLFDRFGGRKRASFAATCRAMLTSCRFAREVDVAAAYQPLARHWHGGWVFPELTYAEFLARLASLIKRHGALGPVERLMFRPWLNPPPGIEPGRPAATSGRRKNTAVAPVPRAA